MFTLHMDKGLQLLVYPRGISTWTPEQATRSIVVAPSYVHVQYIATGSCISNSHIRITRRGPFVLLISKSVVQDESVMLLLPFQKQIICHIFS
jgi:hypothetical protein